MLHTYDSAGDRSFKSRSNLGGVAPDDVPLCIDARSTVGIGIGIKLVEPFELFERFWGTYPKQIQPNGQTDSGRFH